MIALLFSLSDKNLFKSEAVWHDENSGIKEIANSNVISIFMIFLYFYD